MNQLEYCRDLFENKQPVLANSIPMSAAAAQQPLNNAISITEWGRGGRGGYSAGERE
jgi:hypothetical protein